ncbi:MAG: acetyl-CoA carboxylase biotin carboxyl carrier protein subunit [bacterium]|jgi:pyruvate carboxylase subunit B|nr:acetyl-CoA carboxylase biotin carboxyl carrier protein subunit [bacterium]
MPGLILRLECKEGQSVKKNQLVMVMEAMKMENEIYAPCDGTVTKISVSQGQQVVAGDALLTIA